MADYPDSVYSPRTKENRSGVSYEPTKKSVLFAEDISKLDDEVVAIETELGANPKGDSADVAARLDALAAKTIFDKFIDIIKWITDIDYMSWNVSLDGNSNANFNNTHLELVVDNTIDHTAVVSPRDPYIKIVDSGKLLTVDFQIVALDRITSSTIYLIFVNPNWPYFPNDTDAAIGFVIKNGTIYGHCADGSNYTDTTTGVTFSLGTQRTRLRFVFNPGTNCKFYVNDVLKCTITANLPTATDLYAKLAVKTLIASFIGVKFGRILIQKEY